MFNPYGMGMGMGMPMMGMPMMGMPLPLVQPTPGVIPGQPGMGFFNSLPGRFGRDMLGRGELGEKQGGKSGRAERGVFCSARFRGTRWDWVEVRSSARRRISVEADEGMTGFSQPYRPPDPSALPPMPFGLPWVARPGQEGFDAYGRMCESTTIYTTKAFAR